MSEITDVQDTSLEQKLLAAKSTRELQEVVNLFNLDIAKKNVIRSKAYSDMVDKVINEMSARIDKYPGQFSNRELLEYMTALQAQLVKNADVNKDLPTIAIQQNNVINMGTPLDKFDRESKDKMRDVLRAILGETMQGDVIENGFSEEANRVD